MTREGCEFLGAGLVGPLPSTLRSLNKQGLDLIVLRELSLASAGYSEMQDWKAALGYSGSDG